MSCLFDPLKVGDLTLPNRIIMAPLTRCRAGRGRIPSKLMADHYVQRASAGLILSEATSVSPMGVGYPDTPGIWSRDQIEGWKLITKAVHEAGGQILMQLWHVGRISHPFFLNGLQPVAPSAVPAEGHVRLLDKSESYPVPRALELKEIPGIIEDFRKGAQNALEAGFDAIEVHGANGYLLDQFLQDSTNKRTDEYGGSIVNRARLMLEVTDAVISVWGAGHVGVHLAPRGDAQSMGDSNPSATFGYVASELGKRNIAFIFAREHLGEDRLGPQLKKAFGGVYIANEGFTKTTAEEVIANGEADAVAFGVLFIANPDLPERFRQNAMLNEPQPATFFASGPEGYTDYPSIPDNFRF